MQDTADPMKWCGEIQGNQAMGSANRWLRRAFRDPLHTLAIVGSGIAVISAGMWLLRDVRGFFPSGPAKGSLIVNINSATADELQTLPGIGDALAQRIISSRPNTTVDELERVSGISARQVDEMRKLVTVDGPTSQKAD